MWGGIPHNKLPDEVAACNMIKIQRRNAAKRTYKTMTCDIGQDFGGWRISAGLRIVYNPSTGHVSLSHCIRYRKHDIYQNTRKKLMCTNAHALEQLEKKRTYYREYNRKRRAEARAQA